MDPDYSAQDVARCDLCKVAIVQSYCDFCHVNLCKPCIGEHISDDYSKHTIVPFQQRRSTPIYPKCETHPNKTCKFQCKDCNILLCSYCLASKQHNKDHELSKLEEIFNQKRDQIQKDREELKLQLLPAYEDIATELENEIASLDVDYSKLTMELSKRREELHREIDNTINQRQNEIDENKVKHLSILKKHLEEIKQLQSLMQETIHTLNEKEDSNEVIRTISYSSINQKFSKLPPKVNVSMPKFIPQQINKEDLGSLIGKLIPLSTTLEVRDFTAKKRNTLVRELLDEPKFLTSIKTEQKELLNVTCLTKEEIWTSGQTVGDIKCFNTQGVLQKTIKTKSGKWPNDIGVYSNDTLVYTDSSTRTVYKVKNNQTEGMIRLHGWRPTQLFVTSGYLLVTMYSDDKSQCKVVRYSETVVIQTIQFNDDGQPLYSGNGYPKYITENRNLDICMADFGAGAVVVVNQAGKLRFRYTGQFPSIDNKPFKPWGITTDNQSRILTADSDNHCIHILDKDGQFLRYIDNCDLKDPTGLCVDTDESLFVCEFYSGHVKRIRFLK
uniref:Uncharacterized protein LOC111100982 n=1 Tax=Crassostrea virginica TaxID=6565 RepID=A0A8B8AEF0_CRAVI|nr:uncharacterized protein LOC111100982 [Crassostrea virginica]